MLSLGKIYVGWIKTCGDEAKSFERQDFTSLLGYKDWESIATEVLSHSEQLYCSTVVVKCNQQVVHPFTHLFLEL